MALRVSIDRPVCVGAGNCIAIAPTVFDWLRGRLRQGGRCRRRQRRRGGPARGSAGLPDPGDHASKRSARCSPGSCPRAATRRAAWSRRSCSRTSSARPTSPSCSATRRGQPAQLARRDAARPVRDAPRRRRSWPPATASSSASTRPTMRWRAPSPSSSTLAAHRQGARLRAAGAHRRPPRRRDAGRPELPRQGRQPGGANRVDRQRLGDRGQRETMAGLQVPDVRPRRSS